MLLQGLEHLHLPEELLVPLGGLSGLVDAALHHLQVCHDQLQVDDLDIPPGVGAALHMDHVFVVKAAHHMDDGVGGPDIAQKLVAQALALGGALHQTRDIHELDHCRGVLLGLIELCQKVQPAVGHGHHAHVGLDGAEGEVGGLGPRVGDGVKEGGLAHIGQADDT